MRGDYEQPELYLERAAEAHLRELGRLPSAGEVEPIAAPSIPWAGPVALRIQTINRLPPEVQREIQRRASRTYYHRHHCGTDRGKGSGGVGRKPIGELTEEQREARRAYWREQNKKRAGRHREYQRARAANMTEEEKEARRLYHREYYRRRHAKAVSPVSHDSAD